VNTGRLDITYLGSDRSTKRIEKRCRILRVEMLRAWLAEIVRHDRDNVRRPFRSLTDSLGDSLSGRSNLDSGTTKLRCGWSDRANCPFLPSSPNGKRKSYREMGI
jgi:hypothetical protein